MGREDGEGEEGEEEEGEGRGTDVKERRVSGGRWGRWRM